MSEGESIPPIQVEVQSHPIAHWPERVRREEKTLASLGIRDEEATRVFRHYYLLGEEYIRETAEGQKSMVRALLDPEEYVVRIEGKEGFNNLLKAIQTAQQRIRRGAKKTGFPHFPIGTTMEMIVGETSNPSVCYRFTILDAQRREEKLIFTVDSNVEHEKDWGSVMTAARFSQEQGLGAEAIEETKPKGERKEGKPSVIIRESSLIEGQKQIAGHPRIAVGGRTGNKVLHQRRPENMTQFIEENSDLEIDPTRDHLWVVVLDARAYRQSQKEIKRRNLPANK